MAADEEKGGCSPQVEDGYTRIANELLEALSRIRLPGRQWQIVLLVIRMTYGYQRKAWETSNAEIGGILGISKSHLSEDLKELLSRDLISVPEKGNGYKITIGIQKKYGSWKPFPKTGTSVPENGNEAYPKSGTPSSRKKKEKIKKGDGALSAPTVPEKGNSLDKSKRRRQLPPDFPLSDDLKAYAAQHGSRP